ncbi:hypothetical protein [Maribacter sp. 2307ULW6-5]|uniref:hypothetical protein n=1 Tax=Maribacter sp. 2307ULW6-5 TaxID=3386275 RepID=UPI0039BCB94D
MSKKVCDALKMGASYGHGYRHMHFPRPNLIPKTGGIANFGRVADAVEVVPSIEKKKDVHRTATLKKADGTRFFGTVASLRTNLAKALPSGKLVGS